MTGQFRKFWTSRMSQIDGPFKVEVNCDICYLPLRNFQTKLSCNDWIKITYGIETTCANFHRPQKQLLVQSFQPKSLITLVRQQINFNATRWLKKIGRVVQIARITVFLLRLLSSCHNAYYIGFIALPYLGLQLAAITIVLHLINWRMKPVSPKTFILNVMLTKI